MNQHLRGLGMALLAMGLLSACSMRDCGSDAKYLAAPAPQPLVIPAGVSLAPPSPQYVIPPGGEGELILSQDEQTADGKRRTRCLFEPPRLAVEPEAS